MMIVLLAGCLMSSLLLESCQVTAFVHGISTSRGTGTSALTMTTSLDASETLPLPLIDVKTAPLSGIGGKLLVPREYPSLNEVKAIIPSECYERNTKKSMLFALQDLAGVAACAFAGVKFLLPAVGVSSAPLSVLAWTLYSLITGTVAIGMWVTAHECGHGAFSNNRKLQDFIGYIFHTILLVPYYSWQRSHSVHHAFTNHIDDGETHVPPVKATNAPSDSGTSMKYQLVKLCGKQVGEVTFGCIEVFKHLVVGWPAYIGFGATGGPSRGLTSHFVPFSLAQDRSKELFPPRMHDRVWKSDIGIAAMVAVLCVAVSQWGVSTVAALYGGPMLVVNAWLVGYTWLQHTEVDIPHLPADNFSFIKGAFHTVDRPYGDLLWGAIDYLHHRIGSTHVAHHIDSTIPHYHARKATEAIAEHFPDLYMYEPTPIFQAMWRLATKCFEVEPRVNDAGERLYVFTDQT